MGQPVSRNAAKKALVIVVCLAAAIIVTKLYLKTIAVLILITVLVYALLTLTTKKEKDISSGATGKSDKISFGKLIQLLQYLIYGLIAVALIRLFIGQ
jgi:hypothetical protein